MDDRTEENLQIIAIRPRRTMKPMAM